VPEVDPEIAGFYALGHEAKRLWTWGRLERLRTEELLARFLPAAPATVLDVGGGPGAYAVWLARRGYAVHLVDPVELHLEQARETSARQAAGLTLEALVAIEGLGHYATGPRRN
jgi:2-polyprenyl-3-methyl-5-hydroxy-6-metoxy-1,4-benzoquinol methylase